MNAKAPPPPKPATPAEAALIIRAALEAEGLWTSQVESGQSVTITTKRPDHAPQIEIDVRYHGNLMKVMGEALLHYGADGKVRILHYGAQAITSMAKRVAEAIDNKVKVAQQAATPEALVVPEYLEAQKITDGAFEGRYRVRFAGLPPTLTQDQLERLVQIFQEAE